MKPRALLLLLLSLFLFTCSEKNPQQITNTPPTEKPQPVITDPTSAAVLEIADTIPETEAERLLAELNSWPEDELDAYERPEEYPGFVSSGETGGWVLTHKELLKDEGVRVKWNAEKMQYEIK
jgi:hypothetical protein